MRIVEVADHPTVRGPAENFTGVVWSQGLATGDPPEPLQVASITFEPGARTLAHEPFGIITPAVRS